eukprot:gene6335-9263_t
MTTSLYTEVWEFSTYSHKLRCKLCTPDTSSGRYYTHKYVRSRHKWCVAAAGGVGSPTRTLCMGSVKIVCQSDKPKAVYFVNEHQTTGSLNGCVAFNLIQSLGKISLLSDVVVTSPTIGSNVEEVTYKNLHFVMWDIGGQDSLRSSWATYYTDAQALIMVIDSTDRERLPLVREELFSMLAHEDLHSAHVLIFANKQDVKGAMSSAEISRDLKLTCIKEHNWHIQSCCGLTGEGLYEGLEWLTEKIKKG